MKSQTGSKINEGISIAWIIIIHYTHPPSEYNHWSHSGYILRSRKHIYSIHTFFYIILALFYPGRHWSEMFSMFQTIPGYVQWMLSNIHECSRIFQRFQKLSGMFPNVRSYYQSFQNAPDWLKILRNSQEIFRTFLNIL